MANPNVHVKNSYEMTENEMDGFWKEFIEEQRYIRQGLGVVYDEDGNPIDGAWGANLAGQRQWTASFENAVKEDLERDERARLRAQGYISQVQPRRCQDDLGDEYDAMNNN